MTALKTDRFDRFLKIISLDSFDSLKNTNFVRKYWTDSKKLTYLTSFQDLTDLKNNLFCHSYVSQDKAPEDVPKAQKNVTKESEDVTKTPKDVTKMKVSTKDKAVTAAPDFPRTINYGDSKWAAVAKAIEADKNALKKYPADLEELQKLLASTLDECNARFEILRHHPGLAGMLRETCHLLPCYRLRNRAIRFLDILDSEHT